MRLGDVIAPVNPTQERQRPAFSTPEVANILIIAAIKHWNITYSHYCQCRFPVECGNKLLVHRTLSVRT